MKGTQPWVKHILSLARPSKFIMLNLWLCFQVIKWIETWATMENQCIWNLNTVFSPANKCPGFYHFADEISWIRGLKLGFLILGNHWKLWECFALLAHQSWSRGSHTQCLGYPPLPAHLWLFPQRSLFWNSPPKKEHEAEWTLAAVCHSFSWRTIAPQAAHNTAFLPIQRLNLAERIMRHLSHICYLLIRERLVHPEVGEH